MNRRKWFKTVFGAAVATAAGASTTVKAAAKTIPFSGATTTTYRGAKFQVMFCKITTPEFTKNVDKIRTYKPDMRHVMKDQQIKKYACKTGTNNNIRRHLYR